MRVCLHPMVLRLPTEYRYGRCKPKEWKAVSLQPIVIMVGNISCTYFTYRHYHWCGADRAHVALTEHMWP